MRAFFSSLRTISGRPHTPSPPDETQPQHVWRRVITTLLPPLSMLLSFGALTWLLPHQGNNWNWVLPIGLMFLLLTHELGHLLVLHWKGIPARGPFFIPLLGAFVMMSRPSKGEDVAQIALAGPFFGGLGALFCLILAWMSGAQYCDHWSLTQNWEALGPHLCDASGPAAQWLALAHIGFLFNLINLIPLLPFDGGQAIGIASRWLWLLGLPVGILFLLTTAQQSTPTSIILSAVVLATLLFSIGVTCYTLWKSSSQGTGNFALPPVPFGRRIVILLLYALLSSALFLGDNLVLSVLR